MKKESFQNDKFILDQSILKDCPRGTSLFNSKGLIQKSTLTHEYYKIYCLLLGKSAKIYDMVYPFIFFKSNEQFQIIKKIGKLAEKKGLQYIDTGFRYPDGQKKYVIYLDPNLEKRAQLLAYLGQIKIDSTKLDFQDRMNNNWLIFHLFDYPTSTIRGSLLNLYYRKNEEMLTAYRKKYPQELPEIDKELERRYQFVKDLDNFRDFNQRFKEARKVGLERKKELMVDPEFLKFHKTHRGKPFRFPLHSV